LKYSNQLKIIRLQNKFTQQQLADALGITRSAYCGYEIGRRSPDLDTIIRISEFYNLSLVDFFSKLDNNCVSETSDFDSNEEEWWVSKLTKEERALIASVRSMEEKDKKEVYNLAKSKVNSKK
jgi:transcriptional regulator with XRE-family HTH domain